MRPPREVSTTCAAPWSHGDPPVMGQVDHKAWRETQQTPRRRRAFLLAIAPHQPQRGPPGSRTRSLAAGGVARHLPLPQMSATFAYRDGDFAPPPPRGEAHHRTGRPLQERGHKESNGLRPVVPPLFAAPKGDITELGQRGTALPPQKSRRRPARGDVARRPSPCRGSGQTRARPDWPSAPVRVRAMAKTYLPPVWGRSRRVAGAQQPTSPVTTPSVTQAGGATVLRLCRNNFC
jgi:hypothetical protein